MPEVIELFSSSSPGAASPEPRHVASTTSKSLLEGAFDFGSDDFDETGSIDFHVDRANKRRRLTPDLDLNEALANPDHSQPQLTLELSSDTDNCPDSDREIFIQPTKSSVAEKRTKNVFDEITFSSSAPELRHIETKASETQWNLPLEDPADDLDDVLLSLSQPTRSAVVDQDYEDMYSNRTANLLANLSQTSTKEKTTKPRLSRSGILDRGAKRKPTTKVQIKDDIEFSSSPVNVRTPRPARVSDDQKAVKAAERASARVEKEAAKEAEKERKRMDREKRAQEKQKAADLAEVNKSRISKKDATPEMILDMSGFLRGSSVGNQVQEYMRNVRVEVNYVDEEVDLTDSLPDQDLYGNVVKWRRKVKATYNEERGHWEPTLETRIVKEKHVLVHLPAVEFAAMIAGSKTAASTSRLPTEEEMKANLDAHVASIRRRFHDCILIYLVEGLEAWIKKNVNAKNRAYTAAVRAQLVESTEAAASSSVNPQPTGSQAKSRKRKKAATDSMDLTCITSDVVEDLLLHLQLAHQPILIHHTTSPGTTASQISALTQHLSTRPYRLAQLDYNLKSASFCMDTGQVRTGDDAKDTFVKMLQEVQRVTPSMAYGIVDQWPSVSKLVKGFEKHGNLMLEDVRKTVNKDGAWSDRKLGPMISRRLYKVFMGRDPAATDGMS
ncbi:hypothetical protein ABEF95_014799 [Exophiala dermatitidis]